MASSGSATLPQRHARRLRRGGKALVGGRERGAEFLRERYILRVVGGQVVAKPPGTVGQYAGGVAQNRQLAQVGERLARAAGVDFASSLPTAQNAQGLDVEQVRR